LKVFGGPKFDEDVDRSVRMVVAVNDKKELQEILGLTQYMIKTYWALTFNENEIDIAGRSPGVIFKYPANSIAGELVPYVNKKSRR
jgi:hypothetical protein